MRLKLKTSKKYYVFIFVSTLFFFYKSIFYKSRRRNKGNFNNKNILTINRGLYFERNIILSAENL